MIKTSEDFGLLILIGSIIALVISNIIRIEKMEQKIEDLQFNLYDLTYRIDSTGIANDTIEYFSTKTQHYETME